MHFWVSFFLLFSATLNISANIGPQGFRDYVKGCFVETGSEWGNAIQKALDAGFRVIHSLEVAPNRAAHCKERYKNYPNVHVWNKDSSTELWDVISTIHEPATFWLDAHYPGESPLGGNNTALMGELEQIKRHPIKTHTIMIDDLHCCGTALFDHHTKEEIIQKVLEINPNYTISFIPGGEDGTFLGNILVAFIKE
ncbi:MAG TPA: hypothetical protein VLE96_03250 [Chlamydiales bacterium]|nr:hypothetical protein [Chlamydiales bacterium]